MKRIISILALLALFAIPTFAQTTMVQLSVKKITTSAGQATSYATPITMSFNSRDVGPVSGTVDAQFDCLGKTYLVDETYAQVTASLKVVNGQETLLWGKFDATAGKVAGTYDIVDPVTGNALVLPANARVTFSAYIIETTFVSAGADAGTIALGYATDGAAAIKAALAISDGTNPYDQQAAAYATIPVGTAATWTAKTTAARNIQAVVATQSLTAGVMKIAVKYVIVP